ncbi:MAG: xanthine dehydrogenase family protein molybdopterin-binding subunit [Alphaproteobacteria bacterium]|nr:xanthine dehydrogenase family protein molybdopterin-binding subunit [Alphaproteobacteria bacterium]MCA0448150.1 molybdopterin-dependent oxidoreductase [Pseudomonadota bacterium]
MTKNAAQATGIGRRGFLKASAGLAFAFTLVEAGDAAAQGTPSRLNAYIAIGTDGTIRIAAPAPEMGQATNTALPLIIAEELDADWAKVVVETAPVAAAYDHPIFRAQFVVGSLTTRGYWMAIRTAGAQARRVLIDAAAQRWNVPASELSTEPSAVVHKASNRRLSYGEIASFAQVPAQLPEIQPDMLKKPADFRLIGRDVRRWDVPAKATGKAVYAIDVQVPGMLYATLARSPVMGSTPQGHNGAELLRRPGIVAIVPLAQGVAVVGDKIETVLAARADLKVDWSPAPGSNFDSERGREMYLAHVRDPSGQKVVVGRRTGDANAALQGAARVVSGEFTTDYVYHAQMEPLTCVASVTADGVEVWTGTQWASRARDDAAKAAGVAPEKVKVNMMQMGGGFGRRAQIEYVVEAVEVSKAVGKPVKLMSTREDDVANAHCRPMTAHKIDIGLDAGGKIAGWRHRIAADLVVTQVYGQPRLDAQNGVDHIVMAHADVPLYDVASHLAEHVYEAPGVRSAAWRGIGAGPNAFAIEAMIDELAALAGEDPVAYRMKLLKDRRARTAVEVAADMAGWPKAPRNDVGYGIALSRLGVPQLGEAIAVTIVEAALDRARGNIAVRNVWCAADVGLPVQPRNIRQQVEGSLVWGLSAALSERITFKNGAVQQQNLSDYEVLRVSRLPKIEINIIRSGEIPLPVGELGLGTIAPAISNAVRALTGKRLAGLPFTPERVRATLA